jgi:hypothetical protein
LIFFAELGVAGVRNKEFGDKAEHKVGSAVVVGVRRVVGPVVAAQVCKAVGLVVVVWEYKVVVLVALEAGVEGPELGSISYRNFGSLYQKTLSYILDNMAFSSPPSQLDCRINRYLYYYLI